MLPKVAEIPGTDRKDDAKAAPLRWNLGWQIGGFLLVFILVTLSVLPPIATLVARGEDKFLHAAAYAILTLYYCGVVRPRFYIVVVLGLMALGTAIEFLQGIVGYRVAEVQDVLANGLGIAIGLALAGLGMRGWARVVERRISGGGGTAR